MYLARAVVNLLRRGTVWALHRVLCDANKDQLLALCARKSGKVAKRGVGMPI